MIRRALAHARRKLEAPLARQIEALRSLSAETNTRIHDATQANLRLRDEVAALRQTVAELHHAHAVMRATVDDHERQLRVRTLNDWLHYASLTTRPLVSVIMPTRDRAQLLPRALASLQAQTYDNWELLVVDDASTDGTSELLLSFTDARLRPLRGNGRGCCAARNIALSHTRGSIIAYLDDDNIMHPDWLKAVVWGFEQRPRSDVLYGAFVVDDAARVIPTGAGDLPRLYLHPYDHSAISRDNVADMGAIAHRAGLPEARFDESLREMGDWDLLLRLTRDAPPFVLPAIALFYTTDAPHRLSGGPTFDADATSVRAKNQR